MIVVKITLQQVVLSKGIAHAIRTVYLIVILAFGIVSVFVTIFVLYCHNVNGEEPIPNWLQKLANHVLIPFSCTKKCSCCTWNCCNRKRKINSQQKDENLRNPDVKKWVEPEISWKELGRIVDSFSFNASLLINFLSQVIGYSGYIYSEESELLSKDDFGFVLTQRL
ncbi:hypothetical protein KUTeg_021839 [Tegillarca granosa]|uniref:Uncharacterized protein n=1 Tax=Tegillarca granosa TaxID=220873 RepID=A0ABQ9E5C3_TEGGR|nr:hypothetical protein KUTeg_021839 [Tegillarca granosa]